VLLTVLLLLWTFLSLCFPLYDTDFWWHLKTGELLWERGIFGAWPQEDWYTFTDFNKPWIDMHWGFQVFIAAIYRLGGANLVILVKAAIITAAVGVAYSAAGRSVPAWLKVLFWIPAVIAISGRGYERPEMLTQLFLALWLYIGFHIEERPRLIWWLPAIQLVWVNCHALFVLGLVVGACYVADVMVREFAQGKWGLEPQARQPSARWIVRAGALVFVACFVSPYFEEGVMFPLTLYRKFSVEQDFYSVNIGEFQQPIQFVMKHPAAALQNPYVLAEFGLWALTAASVLWLLLRGRWSVFRLLLFAGFSNLAWEASRNTNIFSLVAAVVLCANAGDIVAARAHSKSPRLLRDRTWVAAACLTALSLAVVTGLWNRIAEQNKQFALGEAEHWYIHGAAKFAGQPGFPDRAFVSNNGQAAVYVYHNAPERFVFMDARLEVITRETFEWYNRLLLLMARGDMRWQRDLLGPDGKLPTLIFDSRYSRAQIVGLMHTPGWRLVYADTTAAVFLDDKTADRLSLSPADPEPLNYLPKLQQEESRKEKSP
jgi:hypothetical protein